MLEGLGRLDYHEHDPRDPVMAARDTASLRCLPLSAHLWETGSISGVIMVVRYFLYVSTCEVRLIYRILHQDESALVK